MKVRILFFCTVLFVLTFTEVSWGGLLSYTISSHQKDELRSIGILNAADELTGEDRKVWLSPSLNIDLYTEETKTHRSRIGVVPGVGYGIRWNPAWWVKLGSDINSKSLLNLDVYVQGSLIDETDKFSDDDFFAIDVLPAITLIDWVSVGYGYRWKRSQHDGLPSENTPLFSFGFRKAF